MDVNCSYATSATDSFGMFLITAMLGIFDFMVIFGNGMVIAAIFSQKTLHTNTNYMITSLAVSDFLVGIIVLPFSISYAVTKVWVFGEIWCQIWLAMDVWLCTASIYNLVVISADRYMAVTRPLRYKLISSHKIGKGLVSLAWAVAFIICLPPVVIAIISGSNSDTELKKSLTNQSVTSQSISNCDCSPMNNDDAYIIYSAMGSFMVPLFLIMVFNCGIYTTVRRSEAKKYDVSTPNSLHDNKIVLRVHRGNAELLSRPNPDGQLRKNSQLSESERKVSIVTEGGTASPKSLPTNGSTKLDMVPLLTKTGGIRRKSTQCGGQALNRGESRPDSLNIPTPPGFFRNAPSPLWNEDSTSLKSTRSASSSLIENMIRFNSKNRTNSVQHREKAERRVAKTVGIVVGCYVLCWMPFAFIYLLQAYDMCTVVSGCMPKILHDICFWLGYCNSSCNPIIYACCSREFRMAFKKVLLKLVCKCSKRDNNVNDSLELSQRTMRRK